MSGTGKKVSWRSSAKSSTASSCDTSPTVDCCSSSVQSGERRVERKKNELGRVGERSLGWTDCRAATLTFFLILTRRGRGLTERWDKLLRWRHSKIHCTTPTTIHVEERRPECSQRHRKCASRKTDQQFQTQSASSCTYETRLESKRTPWDFPDIYFYTQSLGRPHERRSMASRREQVFALLFVACPPRESLPCASEGPNPLKETINFKKISWQTAPGTLPAGLKFSLRTAQKEKKNLSREESGTDEQSNTGLLIQLIKAKPTNWGGGRRPATAYSAEKKKNFVQTSVFVCNRKQSSELIQVLLDQTIAHPEPGNRQTHPPNWPTKCKTVFVDSQWRDATSHTLTRSDKDSV